jgi:hypothetical protein
MPTKQIMSEIMSFDDDVRRVVEAAVHELTLLAAFERSRVHQTGVEEGRASGLDEGHAKGFAEGRTKGFDEGRAEGQEEAERESQAAIADARAETSAEVAAGERLVNAVRDIDQARTLGEVLDTLVRCASQEIERVAVVTVRGNRIRGWRLVGFDPEPSGTSPGATDLTDTPLGEAGVIADAVRTGAIALAKTNRQSSDSLQGAPAFAHASPGQQCFAAPIALLGEVVAVLYADTELAETDASSPRSQAWRERLEVLARHASRCLEALTAMKAARAATGATDMADRAVTGPVSLAG